MESISIGELEAWFSRAGIAVADPKPHIGRELSYSEPALRTVVVYFGESESQAHLYKIMSIILEIEEDWLLIPRFGTASNLHVIEGGDAAAILFRPPDRVKLIEYLCTRSMDIGGFSADLYVLSTTGNILVTWDHHTASEGLRIQLCEVSQATKLLVALNELGAELVVYYV